ncbi:MAG: methionine adenosyltransferase [Aigarchaeota archaeon]|nr:methionine adenosyltransferase [Aigarchaeota archaeon]MCX8192825.1 methionine adenosyltransferase [Nitrososphaeria archaeon]MDW7986069.1 methionine adenosyltransferase [Nitrososphaerota archaeon]
MWRSQIIVERLDRVPVHRQQTEFVERKGLGHPDYIIDSACEAASRALSRYYKERYGMVLHHNLDKGLLVGGSSRTWFGGGVVETPIYILIAGRATIKVGEEEIPYHELIKREVEEYIRENFRFLNPGEHVVIDTKIRPGSLDLKTVVELNKETPLANDTSFGVGYSPLTPLEKIVYESERMINAREFKSRIPESGEDCKVMGLRIGNKYFITVADSLIASLTPDLDHYLSVKEQIKSSVEELAYKILSEEKDVEVSVQVNTADIPSKNSVYLTVTGTSAESGDDGNTGRGNRVNGLITPNRQMSLEATAGKNARSHVGKIYNVVAKIMSERIYQEIGGIKEIYVRLLSQIGRPINKPLAVSLQYIPEDNVNEQSIVKEAIEIVKEELENITKIEEMVLQKRVTLF